MRQRSSSVKENPSTIELITLAMVAIILILVLALLVPWKSFANEKMATPATLFGSIATAGGVLVSLWMSYKAISEGRQVERGRALAAAEVIVAKLDILLREYRAIPLDAMMSLNSGKTSSIDWMAAFQPLKSMPEPIPSLEERVAIMALPDDLGGRTIYALAEIDHFRKSFHFPGNEGWEYVNGHCSTLAKILDDFETLRVEYSRYTLRPHPAWTYSIAMQLQVIREMRYTHDPMPTNWPRSEPLPAERPETARPNPSTGTPFEFIRS